jgi:hypothetical protein
MNYNSGKFNQSNNFNSKINDKNLNYNNNDSNNDDDEDYEIEILSPQELEAESSESNVIPFILDDRYIDKGRHNTLYEREMKNKKIREKKLEKERRKNGQKDLYNLQAAPVLNPRTENILEKNGDYIPLHKRAVQLHNQHLSQIILNEDLKRIEKINEEEKILEVLSNKYRKYEKEKWDNFVESCLNWKKEVEYKRKAAEIFRYKMEKKLYYKPRINSKSKKIMKNYQNLNHSVDDVFTRLYNDYDEQLERKKILAEENLPPFAPKINNYRYLAKYSNRNKKKNQSNKSYDRFVTDDRDNFFLESQNKIMGKNKPKVFRNVDKFINKKYTNRNDYKSIGPTQPTNNSTIPLNTDGNTLGYSRYITTENPMLTETNNYYVPSIDNTNIFYNDKSYERKRNKIGGGVKNKKLANNSVDNKVHNKNMRVRKNIDNKNYSNQFGKGLKGKDKILLKELNKMNIKDDKDKYNNDTNRTDNSLYKLNIGDSMPENSKENVIITNEKYQNFFDIEGIDDL